MIAFIHVISSLCLWGILKKCAHSYSCLSYCQFVLCVGNINITCCTVNLLYLVAFLVSLESKKKSPVLQTPTLLPIYPCMWGIYNESFTFNVVAILVLCPEDLNQGHVTSPCKNSYWLFPSTPGCTSSNKL